MGAASSFPAAAPCPRSRDGLRFTRAASLFDLIFLSPAFKNRFPPFTCDQQYLLVSIGTSVQTAWKIPPQLVWGGGASRNRNIAHIQSGLTSSWELRQSGLFAGNPLWVAPDDSAGLGLADDVFLYDPSADILQGPSAFRVKRGMLPFPGCCRDSGSPPPLE